MVASHGPRGANRTFDLRSLKGLSLITLAAIAVACAARANPTPVPTLPIPAPVTVTPGAPSLINPLTGLEVADAELLDIPAILISISHFPATARPQAGLSFAPFVFEFSITEGATRFLATFHGEWPAPEQPVRGGCDIRVGAFDGASPIIGNLVWFDANGDGLQSPGEKGIAGLCVNLYDEAGHGLAQATTDSNGHYGFSVKPGRYWVEFVQPQHLRLVEPDAGEDSVDSDPETQLGRVQVRISDDDLTVDAGLVASELPAPTEVAQAPLAQVGPIRSGRLIYRHIARSFQDSCLIFAYASPEVLERLPQCAVVFHQTAGGGYMLGLDELGAVARDAQRRSKGELHYSGYVFSEEAPRDGWAASALEVYYAYQNQSGWYYDAPSQSYLRYVDTSELSQAGLLYPDTDRLTGRQLAVQNIVIVFVKHEVVSPTNLDILLDPGRTGKAILFRDGLSLNIDWSTQHLETEDGPIRFLQKNGQPAELRPGHTWVLVMTPESTVEEESAGDWQVTFIPPEGAR